MNTIEEHYINIGSILGYRIQPWETNKSVIIKALFQIIPSNSITFGVYFTTDLDTISWFICKFTSFYQSNSCYVNSLLPFKAINFIILFYWIPVPVITIIIVCNIIKTVSFIEVVITMIINIIVAIIIVIITFTASFEYL